ncbi:MAG: cupin domain-containing protein [Xanthomonadales bacterium]|nr:cupin domain-containing protein [Xanthomonadales bacterium]
MADRPHALTRWLAARLATLMPGRSLSPQRKAALREQVLARAAGATTRVLRADEGSWRPLCPGIQVKSLRRDPVAGSETSLWRLQPHARVPSHGHASEEECLVIQGAVLVDGETYASGDYLLAEPGTEHAPVASALGAVLLIRSGLLPAQARG